MTFKLKSFLFSVTRITLAVTVLLAVGVSWIFMTTSGATFTFNLMRSIYGLPFNVESVRIEGSIQKGLVFHDVVLTQLRSFPQDVQVLIQRISLKIDGLDRHQVTADVVNARLIVPNSDPVVIQGSWTNGILKANCFARTLDIGRFTTLLPVRMNLSRLSGFANRVDLFIKMDDDKLTLDAKLFVDRIKYKTTIVSQGPGEFHIDIRCSTKLFAECQMIGEASMTEGIVQARRISMDLSPSKVFFKGDPLNPQLNINATSLIDKMVIDVGFRGTLKNPELVLSSDPPYPRDMLLVMMATGKSWQGSSSLTNQNDMSGEVVADFVDYLLLGGQGGNFATRYGLSEYSDADSKRIGLKTSLTQDVRLGFEIEQLPSQRGETGIFSQKVEGEVDVTDRVSVNVSKKVLPQQNTHDPLNDRGAASEKDKGEAQIYLKYQNRF